MAKALLLDNKVVELAETDFEVHPSLVWVDCSNPEVDRGWVYDGDGNFSNPDAMTPEKEAEIEMAALRDYRNSKLRETDHYGLTDQTMTPEMAAYRQALRDIPEQYSKLEDVVWPEKP